MSRGEKNWWGGRDAGEMEARSVPRLEREGEGASVGLSELWLVADWLTQLNPLSDTCVHVCVCERESGEAEKERGTERELHGNSCSNTKWSLLAHYPSFVPFPSISLTQPISLPTHFLTVAGALVCWLETLWIWNQIPTLLFAFVERLLSLMSATVVAAVNMKVAVCAVSYCFP